VEELHAAIVAYLRQHRRPLPPDPPRFCRACGHRIRPGDPRFALGLLYAARRCAECYAREHPEIR
jgi:hypothetical protein